MSESNLPPKHIWLMVDYHMQDGTPVYSYWADRPQYETDVAYVRADEIERLEKLMGECPECRLQAKADRLYPNPQNKTISELQEG